MAGDTFKILGKEIPKGGSAFLELEIAKLHTRTPIKIPVIVNRAKKKGPVLLLMAGVHGDEINGVAIVRDIIAKKHHIPDAGTIICIPVLNVFGYLNQKRFFPDGRDLNRMFPGSAQGSLASQFAYMFRKEIAPLVDYVIDFHTGGASRDNIPQIRCRFTDTKAFELAKVFGTPFIVQSTIISKSVRDTINKMDKTILLFEGGKSKEISQTVIDYGVSGAYNVMKHLGMKKGKADAPAHTVLVKKSKWIRAVHSGMFKPVATNGDRVKKGEVIGIILDPYGEFEKKVKAPSDGHIFCINTAPVINRGNALFHISTEIVS
jgi:uncharacterized protein